MKHVLDIINNQNSQVGEGPLWDGRTQTFFSIDILGKCIWKLMHDSEAVEKIPLPQQVGCIAICENGDMLLAMEDAVYRMDCNCNLTKAHQDIRIKGRRFNDGKIGPDGAFYLGTTDSDGEGAFYRLKDGVLTELFDKCNCSNGLDWTKDRKNMYYIDTPKQMVEIFDFDIESGELTNRRKFVDIPKEIGCPDGMCLDENDNLWVALWNGHKVIHIDKDSCEIKKIIKVPCPKASCCTFGGAEMNELFITTAAKDDFPEAPLAGYTFRTTLDVKGKPIYYYKY